MRKTTVIALTLSASVLALSGCDEEAEIESVPSGELAVGAEPEPEPSEAESPESEPAEAEFAGRVQSGVMLLAIEAECRPGALFFDTDSAELNEDATQTLGQMAECLKGTPQGEEVEVSGRTDPRASEEYNEVLARQRATAVVSYLQTQGVSESDFEITAIGEEGMTEGMPKLHPFQRNATVEPQ